MIYVTLHDALFIERLINEDAFNHASNYGGVIDAKILLINFSL